MKQEKIKIIINGKTAEALEGETILEAAKKNKIDIPSLCYHPDLSVKANCRICMVEIEGVNGLQTACSTKVKKGMKITTDSLKIRKARKINLELIFSQHKEECDDCVWNFNCQILKLAKEYKVEITRFIDRKTNYPNYRFGPSVDFDSAKCIVCRNCAEVCPVNFLEIKDRGAEIQIVPSKDKKKECIYCGQCIVHCPVGAIEGVGEFEDVENPLKEKDKSREIPRLTRELAESELFHRGKIVVAQFAPSIRTSIGEEFNLPYGEIVTEKLAGAIKKLGFNKVFDVSVGADFTTMEESKEFIERLSKKERLPMMTSCCPAWVKFVEFYHPEFISNLTSVRSPHIISGGLIKTFWAEQNNIDPKNIIVVSIMPCVSKKYEITRKELMVNGLRPVDYVLTTRELAYLLIKNKIDLKTIKPQALDVPLGVASGAGVIYGASGGVMESALRTTYEKLTGKKLLKVEFKKVRGINGVKKAIINIKGNKIKIAVINGINNVEKILEELKKDPQAYDSMEVMACPGGCIGGGGQPLPTSAKIRQERAKGLYKIDLKKDLRTAHKNPIVEKVYQEFFQGDKNKIRSICHTKYLKRLKDD